MKYNFYSVYDIKVGYGMPVTQENDAVAMRNFENVCLDEHSVFHTHCSDFSLRCIGTFDTDTGEISPTTPREICAASDFVVTLKGSEVN